MGQEKERLESIFVLHGIINRFSQRSIGMNTENVALDVGLPSGPMITDGTRERKA